MTEGMTLDDMRELNAWTLSDMASCGTPEDRKSPGARMLESVRDSVVDAIERGSITLDDFNDNGQIFEISDDAPSVYTHTRWQQFVDLTAYEEEPEITDTWGENLTEAAGIALYQVADRLAHALCEAWRAGWECPTCGEEVDGPSRCDTDTCGNPAGALVGLARERLATLAAGEPDDTADGDGPEVPAEPLPVRTPGEAMAAIDQADSEAVGAVSDTLTGPVDIGAHMGDPVWDLIHRAEATSGEIRATRLAMVHERAVSRFRRKVWTVAGILAVFAVSAVVIFLG